jgi:hypothetical protein
VPPHDQPVLPTAVPPAAAGDPPVARHGGSAAGPVAAGIVDWHRTGRRLRRQGLVILCVVLVVWLVLGVAGDGPTLRALGELLGLGVLVAIAGEVVIVGGAAVRGMLRAGERGERLASSDVSLLPPQVRRRLGRRR